MTCLCNTPRLYLATAGSGKSLDVVKGGKRELCVWGADHAMQLVEYFESAHIASAALWRESGRILGGTDPFQSVMRD